MLDNGGLQDIEILISSNMCSRLYKSIDQLRYLTYFWSNVNGIVSGAGGLRFTSRAGQVELRAANGSPLLQHFFKRSCVARAQ